MNMSADVRPSDYKTHLFYLSLALSEARKSPPKPTNFCVGACLVTFPATSSDPAEPSYDEQTLKQHILTTGYTLECAGNTHAEQSCFIKLASQYKCTEPRLGESLPEGDIVLYTTMEPCNERSVGNTPCVDRILALKRKDGKQSIHRVVVGVSEPDTFVGVNEGKRRLENAGIQVVHAMGLEEDILAVATAGHEKSEGSR